MEEEAPSAEVGTSKVRRKSKVSKRKVVKKPKRRGECKPAIGVGDAEIAECIISDEEMRSDFRADQICGVLELALGSEPFSTEISGDSDVTSSDRSSIGSSDSVSTLSSSGTESSGSSLFESGDSSHPESACSFTPDSAGASKAGSSCSVQSASACGTNSKHVKEQGPHHDTSVHMAFDSGSASPLSSESATVKIPDACVPPCAVIECALSTFREVLHASWVPVADQSGIHLLLFCKGTPKEIQREIFITFNGIYSIFVHAKYITVPNELLASCGSFPPTSLSDESVAAFCECGNQMSKFVMQHSVCRGADHMQTRELWYCIPESYIDCNPYKESAYTETCRSVKCDWLVKLGKGKKRCDPCSKVWRSLRDRQQFLLSSSVDPSTPNVYLTQKQAVDKLKEQHGKVSKKDKQKAYLTKVRELLEKEGVDIEEDLNGDLSETLANSKLSYVQKMFFQEQTYYSNKADPRAHRWHPHMIRLALHFHVHSASGFESLKDAGIYLPTSGMLYDFSTAIASTEEISTGIIKMIFDRVEKLEKPHQKYHALLFDEMYVSENLVYRSSDGSLVGYTHLDEVDKEVKNLKSFIANNENVKAPILANNVLAFMVKGLTSDVKDVVAVYPCKWLTKDMLYCKTWQVISVLERAGVKILAFVCNGSSVNRGFINMHTPITQTTSGIVFDTLNFCSPEERPLFFISDVSYLVKTIRNCFYDSREGKSKHRCLQLNGELILWKYIVRLYLVKSDKNCCKSYKLNSENVYLNTLTCTKVRYAAEVLSETVANDLEKQNWPGTKEAIRFIHHCNEFFDMLNGAFRTVSKCTRNTNLAPYTDTNDPRFGKLDHFVEYLNDWRKYSEALFVAPQDEAKTMLSRETLEGIEITINGFKGATRYLLQEGAQFVMARCFSQDP